MTTFDYTSFDMRNPGGNNGLSSFAMYYQRLMYKEALYPARLFAPLDTWYDKLYYGRVDQMQNTVIPSISDLQTIPAASKPNLFALNFVVDAFQDFVGQMKNSVILGVIRKSRPSPEGQMIATNGKIYNPKAYEAYQDPTRLYNDYLQQILNQFRDTLLPEQSNQIVNFKSFATHYVSFLQNTARFIPVTKSGYLLTSIFNVLNSGLSIALDRRDADNDTYKYEKWINDPNFTFYVRVAKKFGFIVNKNAPWILTADLFSPAMMTYINAYTDSYNNPITKESFFDSYYMKTYLTDIEDLKIFIFNSYAAFIDMRPGYEERVYLPNCDKYKIISKSRQSEFAAQGAVDAVLTDKYMADLYLALRHAESGLSKDPSHKFKVEMSSIYQTQPKKSITPLQNVADYVNLVYRDYIYSIDYLFLNELLLQKALDNQALGGKISTSGAIAKNIY